MICLEVFPVSLAFSNRQLLNKCFLQDNCVDILRTQGLPKID